VEVQPVEHLAQSSLAALQSMLEEECFQAYYIRRQK
jgi:hypothetical protein